MELRLHLQAMAWRQNQYDTLEQRPMILPTPPSPQKKTNTSTIKNEQKVSWIISNECIPTTEVNPNRSFISTRSGSQSEWWTLPNTLFSGDHTSIIIWRMTQKQKKFVRYIQPPNLAVVINLWTEILHVDVGWSCH